MNRDTEFSPQADGYCGDLKLIQLGVLLQSIVLRMWAGGGPCLGYGLCVVQCLFEARTKQSRGCPWSWRHWAPHRGRVHDWTSPQTAQPPSSQADLFGVLTVTSAGAAGWEWRPQGRKVHPKALVLGHNGGRWTGWTHHSIQKLFPLRMKEQNSRF